MREASNWHDAYKLLVEGNKAFSEGKTTHPERGREVMFSQYLKATPFAAVLACADSRVVPELVFDVGIGELFTCRIAGTVLSDAVIGSIEMAVEVLGVTLIVVMGHENCGAFRACMNPDKGISWQLIPIIEELRPIHGGNPTDHLYHSIVANARKVAQQLQTVGPIISPGIKAGKLKIIPAYHSLSTGKVTFFEPIN